MKKTIHALLCSFLLTASGLAAGDHAHGGVELGPNGGRILEFSKDETINGEVTVKDGKFVIALLDKDKKPVAMTAQTLTAMTGPLAKPVAAKVEKVDGKFVLPVVKPGEWIILQFKADDKAKAVTARLNYNTANCAPCKSPEWLCKCENDGDAKKEEPKKEESKKSSQKPGHEGHNHD